MTKPKTTKAGDNQPEEAAQPADKAADNAVENVGDGGAAETAHLKAVDRMVAIAEETNLDPKALVFDVRDFLLEQIKARPKPWSATSEAEQRDVAAACEHVGTELVRKIVEAIAARGNDPVRVLLTKIAIGDDIVVTGKVKAMGEEEDRAVTLLHHARGKHVMLTVASADDYKADQRDPEIDSDEPPLDFEAGHPDDDSDLAGEEQRLNLQSGMFERLPEGADPDDEKAWVDVRAATPEELAAERDRRADFDAD